MIEFVPFMLFVLGLHPGNPDTIEFRRVEVVYATHGACAEAGEAMATKLTSEVAGKTGVVYQYRCVPLPKGEEVERAWREFSGKSE